MYNVLNEKGEKIVVEAIDKTKHKHLSGRAFTDKDGVKFTKVEKKVIKKVVKEEVKEDKESIKK